MLSSLNICMVKKYGKKLEVREIFVLLNQKAECQPSQKYSTQTTPHFTKKILTKPIHFSYKKGMEPPSAPLSTMCTLDWGGISQT